MRAVLRGAIAAALAAMLLADGLADVPGATRALPVAADAEAAAEAAAAAERELVRAILETVPAVTAPVLRQRLGQSDRVPGLVILDVRTAEEYAADHIPGARNISHEQLANRLGELADARDQELLVYCRSGRRAARAIETLRAAGYANLSHLQGDIQGWQALMAPVSTVETMPPPPVPGPAPRVAGQ